MFHQIMEILFFKMEKSVYFYIYCVGKSLFLLGSVYIVSLVNFFIYSLQLLLIYLVL